MTSYYHTHRHPHTPTDIHTHTHTHTHIHIYTYSNFFQFTQTRNNFANNKKANLNPSKFSNYTIPISQLLSLTTIIEQMVYIQFSQY